MDTPRVASRRRRPPVAIAGWIAAATAGVLLAGCASFPDSTPSVTVQPSLSAVMPSVVTPSPPMIAGTSPTPPNTSSPSSPSSPSGSSSASDPSSEPSQSSQPDPSSTTPTTTPTADPCAPTDPAVVATCLDAPWGLAPLPDGMSALVGERTTGKVFRVAVGTDKALVTTIDGVDASGDGGLLGIALSPYYAEDGLVYAYVTTSADNRILRFAPGQRPKAILTGIPKGDSHNGGPIAFGTDNLLYIATGDAGNPGAAAEPGSLAGKVLRVDTFGKPATGNPGKTAVYASGLTDPTGICPLAGSSMGVLDHRPSSDLLLTIRAGKDFAKPVSGDALWTYQPGDGGGVDCAESGGFLLATSLSAAKITGVQLGPSGGFTGSPEDLVKGTYGRLLSLVTGAQDLVWATTSNKDGHGKPIPSDDRVILLPAAAGGGGGGGPD